MTTRDYPLNMKAVGVKNLKARLSEHLRSVKAGETILVTERDQVIAELRPARGTWYAEGPLDMALVTLADAGELSPPAVSKGHWTLRTPGLGWPRGSALDLLDGVRDDRV